jgi:hypothetical protein
MNDRGRPSEPAYEWGHLERPYLVCVHLLADSAMQARCRRQVKPLVTTSFPMEGEKVCKWCWLIYTGQDIDPATIPSVDVWEEGEIY